MGVLPIVDGQVTIGNYGYVPERPILYEYFTLWEHIDFYMRVAGKENSLTNRANELLKIFHKDHKLHNCPTTFSIGMQQKVYFFPFLVKHSIYNLNEPFIGLNPQTIRKLLTILEELKAQGAQVPALFASTRCLLFMIFHSLE